ncbi:methionyl-tRNA formyltransferase [Sinimarinibacterium sp. CAU 1509]|uniref:methionyl-tRNA formyltransferase n=1 Tax=Sinimarinibacterium sp. CAU 1509 TaxID=2562283 RepID=UPI0010ABCD09|nr:methionyl-tRNA formyltransferase [Sinimarinibacterium sp. CAU 1509]TJY59908.1 methionyl-tRNA formyltransferase [Sinimarinibacterium sp. CAU 1509]
MRVVFAGTPEFAVSALDALHAAGHDIVGVYTQPDRPAGRGRKLSPSPVATRAVELSLPVFKPEKLDATAREQLGALRPEVMVVVAYGLILPQAALDIPEHGCINIHASLLPRWRGAAPIQRAIEAGDHETGVTIMRMDAGLDTGPMLLWDTVPLTERSTAAVLHDQLAALGAKLIVDALSRLQQGTLDEHAQPAEGATYARKLSKDEARIDWSAPATVVAQRIRAFNPAPGAWTELDNERVRILFATAEARPHQAAPGQILACRDDAIEVACGDGCVHIELLQWPGGRPLRAGDAQRGRMLLGRSFR